MEYDYIECGDCLELMKKIECNSINIVLTSPPYNTSRHLSNSQRAIDNHECRYDIYVEKTNNDYLDWTLKLFNEFDKVLKPNGCVLYNLSYGNENPDIMWRTISKVIENTNFTVADTIIWKKNIALPNNTSKNKLTRICEFVFVFCRKNEIKTFEANKEVKSISKTGQKYYENVYNYIEAKNNDGSCSLNKATFSSELVLKLLKMYSNNENDIILDPFLGTGTTAVACVIANRHYIGFELSPQQFEYACKRLDEAEDNLFNIMKESC